MNVSNGSDWLPPGASEPQEEKPKKKEPGGTGQAIFAWVLIGALAFWYFSGDSDSPSTRTSTTANLTVAQKLALIDSNQGHEAEYDRLLDSLVTKCGEERIGVSDTAVRGTQVMKDKRNVTMSALEFLIAMDGAIPPEAAPTNCNEIAAAFITLTGSQ